MQFCTQPNYRDHRKENIGPGPALQSRNNDDQEEGGSTEDSIICNSKKTEKNLPTLFYPCLNIFAQKDNYKEDYYDSKVELQGPKQRVTVFHILAISA